MCVCTNKKVSNSPNLMKFGKAGNQECCFGVQIIKKEDLVKTFEAVPFTALVSLVNIREFRDDLARF